ncbi:hypothetical protein H2203_006729 [Taxawa tesnikishii (nom. ined.)]|nr:hypothetical protein H2203_006729 [Dothideales sp. JES 119]
MRLSSLFFLVFRFLLPPSIIFTVLIYTYPAVQNCAFPEAKAAQSTCFLEPSQSGAAAPAQIAPFRLLALGDPQLEGDTSLPDPRAPLFPSLLRFRREVVDGGLKGVPSSLKKAAKDLVTDDVPRVLRSYRKRLDLFGNDYYLAHIYRSIRWWTQPTHTVVLGDLLGSQWIDDEEFARRTERFWKRVFKGAERVPEEVMGRHDTRVGSEMDSAPGVEGREDWKEWVNWLINVAGNHDIGYAGDINSKRIERFEKAFGRTNWDIRFQMPTNASTSSESAFPPLTASTPELQLIVLNSMNLDSPAWQKEAQQETHAFLNSHIGRQSRSEDTTILLTHIPLHKEAGVCVDGPFFEFFPDGQGGGIKEQNHLSSEGSKVILDGLFGPEEGNSAAKGRGIILNGHDHEGCDVYHYRSEDSNSQEQENTNSLWTVSRYPSASSFVNDEDIHGIREITVRSMMGSYGGNAGLLSAWFDEDDRRWKFEYATCMLGVQHIWWAAHVLDLVVVLFGLSSLLAYLVESELSEPAWGRRSVASARVGKFKTS